MFKYYKFMLKFNYFIKIYDNNRISKLDNVCF